MTYDPASRELCPDGACIGVIGPDGRCKECGAVASTKSPAAKRDKPVEQAGAEDPAAAEESAAHSGDHEHEHDESDGAGDSDGEPIDFAQRQLCSDGTCVGVIGQDGRCRECGKPYDAAADG